MTRNQHPEPTAAKRRESIADDVQAFLKAGNHITRIPSGISGQDPQGKVKPLRLKKPGSQEPESSPS